MPLQERLPIPEGGIIALSLNHIRQGKQLVCPDFKTIWQILKLFSNASKISAIF
jgi:hypothetical protein